MAEFIIGADGKTNTLHFDEVTGRWGDEFSFHFEIGCSVYEGLNPVRMATAAMTEGFQGSTKFCIRFTRSELIEMLYKADQLPRTEI